MKTTLKLALIVFTVFYTIVFCNVLSAQTFHPKPVDNVLKDTTIKSVKYPLYVGSRGGKYILRVSKVTGKQYKQYIKK